MLKLKFLSKKLKEKKTSASKFKEKSLYFMKKSFFPFYNNIPTYYSIFCRISAKINISIRRLEFIIKTIELSQH